MVSSISAGHVLLSFTDFLIKKAAIGTFQMSTVSASHDFALIPALTVVTVMHFDR